MPHRVINPWTWQEEIGFSHGRETTGGRLLYCSGQVSVDADGSPLHVGDMRAQVLQALENVETVLREAGYTLTDVVRLNTYTVDVDAYHQFGRVPFHERMEAAGADYTSTLLGVARLAAPEFLVELEATAVRD